MKKLKAIVLVLLSFAVVSCGTTAQNESSKDVMSQATTTITSEAGKNAYELDVKSIMEEICSDEYLGRIAGTEENIKAGQFIKNYYETIGLSPFNGESFFQNFKCSNLGANMSQNGSVDNVVGFIKGKDSSKAIVISAHFDHVAYQGTTKLPGAIDNASGIATLLEVAKDLSTKSKEEAFKYDIVFAAFNAEEEGLFGSDAFVDEYKSKYDQWYNINIDCIGMNTGKGLAVKNQKENCNELYKDFIKVLDENNVKYEDIPYASQNGRIVGTSDHAIFQHNGDAALVVGQDGIGGIVHTPDDNLSVVDFDNITQIKNAIVDFVNKNSEKMY